MHTVTIFFGCDRITSVVFDPKTGQLTGSKVNKLGHLVGKKVIAETALGTEQWEGVVTEENGKYALQEPHLL